MPQLFDNAMRELGGIGEKRPSWETTPSTYPITGLPWGGYFDASNVASIATDVNGDVGVWTSLVRSPLSGNFETLVGPGIPYNPAFVAGATPSGKRGVAINYSVPKYLSGGAVNTSYVGPRGLFFAVLYPNSVPTASGVDYQDGNVFSDSANAETTFGVTSGGFSAAIYDGVGYKVARSGSVSATNWHLCEAAWNGATVRAKIDSAATWNETASAAYSQVTPSVPTIGNSYAGVTALNATLAFMGIGAGGWNDVRIRDVERYLTATYLTGGAASYSMTATVRSYALIGPATLLKAQRKIVATVRALVLTGTATGLTKQSKIVATAQSYALIGTATGLSIGRKISCTAASYTLTGTATGLTKQSKIVATAQSYALIGTATGLSIGRKITATARSYALTGQAALFAITRGITATARSYALTGQAVGFGVAMPAATRALSLVGQNAGLTAQRKLSATAQSYSLAGPAVGFDVKMLATAAAFALVTNDAGLYFGRKLAATAQSYSLVGNPTGAPAFTRRLDAQTASYALDGTVTGIRAGRELLADAASYALDGGDAQFGVTMPAAARSYALAGQDVSFAVMRELACVSGSYALAGTDTWLRATRRLGLVTGSFALAGNDATLKQGKGFSAITGSFAFAGSAASFVKISRIAPSAGAFALDGVNVGLNRGYFISVSAGAYTLGGGDITGSFTRRIAPDAGAFALDGPDVVLHLGITAKLHTQVGAFVLQGNPIDFAFTYIVIVAIIRDDAAYSIDLADGPLATIDLDDGPEVTITLADTGRRNTMSSERFYDVGDVIEITGTIRRRITGVLVDPDTLTVHVEAGGDPAYPIVYDGIDARIVRDSAGVYRTLIEATLAMAGGEVVVQYNATGEVKAMQPHTVRVRAPRIVV